MVDQSPSQRLLATLSPEKAEIISLEYPLRGDFSRNSSCFEMHIKCYASDVQPTAPSTASNDHMSALRNVFDINNSSTLDAGDDQFSSLKVLAINANGTARPQTPAQAWIALSDLVPDAKKVALPDGSTTDGEATYTHTDSSTGTDAAVTLTAATSRHIRDRTVTSNGDGQTTITARALNLDGGVAYEISENNRPEQALWRRAGYTAQDIFLRLWEQAIAITFVASAYLG